MADNGKFTLDLDGKITLNVAAVNGSGTGDLVMAGDPGTVGDIAFVALTDEDADGNATCATRGVFTLNAKGANGAGNVAIAVGDKVYWDGTPGEVNADVTNGVLFGRALGAVASGATTAIDVMLTN